MKIWNRQGISRAFENTLRQITEKVQDKLINNGVMSNIGQYCKRPVAWEEVKKIDMEFSEDFTDELIEAGAVAQEVRSAKADQKTTNQVVAEVRVVEVGVENWRKVLEFGKSKRLTTPKEEGPKQLFQTSIRNSGGK